MRALREAVERWLGRDPSGSRAEPAAREVRCYHCGLRFDVPTAAMTSSCPRCSRHLGVRDLVIGGTHWAGVLQTCATLWIKPRGRAGGNVAIAGLGARIEGTLDGPLLSGGPVVVASTATIRGGVIAPMLEIEDGARVLGGHFQVPRDPIGSVDLDEMMTAARRPPARRYAHSNVPAVRVPGVVEPAGAPAGSSVQGAVAPSAAGAGRPELRLVYDGTDDRRG